MKTKRQIKVEEAGAKLALQHKQLYAHKRGCHKESLGWSIILLL